MHQRRKALRAGELEERRKTLLDAPEAGMVWEPGEEVWEAKLAALRSCRRATGHLAPRQNAMWGEDDEMVPIGQPPTQRRQERTRQRPGTSRRPRGAAERDRPGLELPLAAQLATPPTHPGPARFADEVDGVLPDIAPGVLFEGDDIGRWL